MVGSRSRWLALLMLSALGSAAPTFAACLPAVRAGSGMVVSPDRQATDVGVAVLQAGGNAVDAAVAVALALAVTYPPSGNLAGGGFMLYREPDASVHALDFRETAPHRLRAEMFLDEDGRPIPGVSLRGGLAVAVPGSVRGLHDAHRRWGRLDWPQVVEPAIRLAQDGTDVSRELARQFAREAERLLADPEACRVFAPDGSLPLAGERLRQPDLAASLERIAAQGPNGFHEGPVAEAVVRTVERYGGVLDLQDLADYRPLPRDPVEGRYRGYRVISFPPPSSGGIILLQLLATLERFDLRDYGPGSSLSVHFIAEAERLSYADRSHWMGDPDFFRVPVRGLLDPGYLNRRAAGISSNRARPSSEVLPGTPPVDETEDTLHLSVADEHGGAVALTTTLNGAFGAGIVAEGTGILLNNEIDDFALAPGFPNMFGLVGDGANSVVPGKRPLSSMTPTIVELPGGGKRPFLVLGSPGGSKIITSVLQVLINVVDHGMPLQEAVNWPRFHHQWLPDRIQYEERAFSGDVLRALRARGQRLEATDRPLGNVNAIGLGADGAWLGAADPRRRGTARGY